MKGLLYKDFVLLKGKWIVIVSIVILVGFAVLRFALPGTEMGMTYRIELADGSTGRQHMGYMYDVILFFIYSSVEMVYLVFPIGMAKYMFEADEKSKSKVYMLSLPFKKEDYVASKYVLYLIMYYVSESMLLLLFLLYRVTAVNAELLQKAELSQSMSIGLVSVFLIVHAIQLPAFYLKGSQRAEEINTMLGMAVAFVGWLALLFVDFDKVDIAGFIMKHQTWLIAISSVLFWVVLGLYYLSYRFTVKHLDHTAQEYLMD